MEFEKKIDDPREGRFGKENRQAKVFFVDSDGLPEIGQTKDLQLNEPLDFTIGGVAGDVRAGLIKMRSVRPQIVIVDPMTTEIPWDFLFGSLEKIDPEIKVIIYSRDSYQDFFRDVAMYPISGYVMKGAAELGTAIDVVKRGGAFFSEDVSEIWAEYVANGYRFTDPLDSLSRRERQIFVMMAETYSVVEVAGKLGINPKTVETHKYGIMKKLRIRSKAQWRRKAMAKRPPGTNTGVPSFRSMGTPAFDGHLYLSVQRR